MSINQRADSIHFSRYPQERQYANALSEGFDITFADRFRQFSYWIASPHDHLRQRFGFLQELLVLFSEHAITDARALQAINELSSHRELRLRIDKFIYLVIHRGSDESIADLLKQFGDRIIIPIAGSELADPQRGAFFLRAKIAAAVGGVDLYEMSSPVRADKDFFGREDLVQLLTSRSLHKRESSGLFGLRKTGKTSVLFAIDRRTRDANAFVEYIDCQNPGIHAMRWWQLLAEIADRLFKKIQIPSPESRFYGKHIVGANAASAFTHDIKLILEKTKSQIILMLDEIEYITHGLSGALGRHWDEDFHPFWATIRSVQQESEGNLTFIVAGVNPSCVEQPHFGSLQNPIFQLAVPQYLEPLKRDGLRGMVRTLGRYGGLDFEESVYGYLQQVYGGHPYLVRLACSEVWKAFKTTEPTKNTTISQSAFVDLRSPIRSRLAQPIKDILLSLVWWYPEEYDLLRILASGSADDKDFVDSYLKQMPEQITQFARYGLLTTDSHSFAIADLQNFLVDQGLQYKQEMSPFSRSEMPQHVIAESPNLDLLGKLFKQKAELERDLRRIVLAIIGASVVYDQKRLAKALLEGIRPRSDRKRPEDLFIGREPREVISDIYMSDLKTIILAHWDKFKAIFNEKNRFEMNMDSANQARRLDAHTIPITESEMLDYENSYHWLGKAIRPVLANLP